LFNKKEFLCVNLVKSPVNAKFEINVKAALVQRQLISSTLIAFSHTYFHSGFISQSQCTWST